MIRFRRGRIPMSASAASSRSFGDITKLAFSIDGSLLAASRIYVTSDGVTLNEVQSGLVSQAISHAASASRVEVVEAARVGETPFVPVATTSAAMKTTRIFLSILLRIEWVD